MKAIRKAEPDSPAESKTPYQGVALSLTDNSTGRTELTIMFRIISRRDWDRLQGWHRACPGSTVEHLMYGLYVLAMPAGGAEVAG